MVPGMGYRTIKTAIGAGLAMWLVSFLDLEFSTFAAIIVVMCIEKTKKRTVLTIKDKLFASLLSLILGMIVFELLAYNPLVLALFIFLFVPLLMKLEIQNGFITSMVILTHVYSFQEASVQLFLNELYVIAIGMGIALLVNSVMPSFKKDITKYKATVEGKFSTILYEFHAFLKDGSRAWAGREIKEAEIAINTAKTMILQDIENQFLREENKDYYYFKMREQQLETLKKMITIVGIVGISSLHVEQKEMIANLLLEINAHTKNKEIDAALEKLKEYDEMIRESELPQSREEFEIRANLFYLNFEIKNYIGIEQQMTEEARKLILADKAQAQKKGRYKTK